MDKLDLERLLEILHPPEQVEDISQFKCMSCVVVGSGSCLRNSKLHFDL